MSRKSIHSTSLLAQVRRYFNLHQHELATYLGISPELVKHIEAGRRTLTSPVLLRLMPLAQLLPATPAPTITLELPPTAPPDPAPLVARCEQCLHEASKLRQELRALAHTTQRAQRWRQALPALLVAAPAEATDPHVARARRWLLVRQEQAAADLDGSQAARYHLLRLRAEVLEAEAAALARLLPSGS